VLGVRARVDITQVNSVNYCENVLYKLALGVISTQYGLVGLAFLFGTIGVIYGIVEELNSNVE